MEQHRAQLKAGTARADITPPVGIAHGNWGAATHERAEGVDLPLWATALTLFDGETRAAIVDVDALHFPRELCVEMRSAISAVTGIPPEHIRVSASHTHSGPSWTTSTWVRQGVDMVEPYVAAVKDKLAGAVWEAMRAERPVTAGYRKGECRVNVNRRLRLPDGRIVVGQNPSGFVDPEVIVLQLDEPDGSPVATIVNYACHPTIMAHLNRLITPDYPGQVRRVVEASVGGRCLFLQGATGNQASIEDLSSDPASYRRIGNILGHEAAKLVWSIRTPPGKPVFDNVLESGAPLGLFKWVEEPQPARKLLVFERDVEVATKDVRPAEELQAEWERQMEVLDALRAQGADEEAIRDASYKARRLGIQVGLARRVAGRRTITIPVQVMALGDIAFLCAPVEIFAEIGVAIKQKSPFALTVVSGYSNGAMGYLPTAQAHREGGYEVDASPFGPEAEGQFTDACLAMLREAFSAR